MDHLLLAITVLFHPADTFRLIKRDRSRLCVIPSLILLGLMLVSRVVYIYFCHFPLALFNPEKDNVLQDLAAFVIVLFSFVIIYYVCTSIIGGEVFFREALLATALCTVPYTVFTPILAVLSHIMSQNQVAFFRVLSILIWLWVIILGIMSVYTMNSYSPPQTAFILIVTVAAVFIFWAVCILIYALCNQFYEFIKDLLQEIRIRFF